MAEYLFVININPDEDKIIRFLERRIRKNERGLANYLRQTLDIDDPLSFDIYFLDNQKTELDHYRSIRDQMIEKKCGFLLIEIQADDCETVKLEIFRAILAADTPLKKAEIFLEIKNGGGTITFVKQKIPR